MRAVLILASFLAANALPCPYTGMDVTSILASTSDLCGNVAQPCLLSPKCRVLSSATTTTTGDGTIVFRVDAVGDMTSYTSPYLAVAKATGPFVDLSLMTLPRTLTDFQAIDFNRLPRNFTWPPTLTTLAVFRGPPTDVPSNLPESITQLRWDAMGLTNMPSIAPQWTYLTVSSNPIAKLVNVDLSNITEVSFIGNPTTTIANLTLSSKLKYFAISGNVTTLIVSESSYRSLNRLAAKPSASTIYSGYEVHNFITVLDAATCTRAGGVLQPLWSKGSAPATYTACVVPDPEPRTTLPPATTSPTTNDASSHVGVIVGISVATVVVVVVLGFCLRKRRRGAMTSEDTGAALGMMRLHKTNGTVDQTFSGAAPASNVRVDLDALRMVRLEHSELRVTSDAPLAAGAHGEVWRATYLRQPVAIKRTKDPSEKAIAKMAAEILLMSRMNCPYIVSLIGANWTRPNDLECVVEYMDRGDLRSFLASTSPTAFTWAQKSLSISQVVRGLVYLHTFETPIIHRDLKSRNVLLDSKKGTKLTDFGESREMDEETLTNGIGTYQWMAPEIFTGHDYSTAADVYSFGVLLSEYSTHRVPYADMINPRTNKPMNQQFIMHQVTSGAISPTFETSTTPTWVLELAKQCLAFDPEDRPSTLQIVNIVLKATSA
ncbi:TKL protein kinase [Saprolegnia diclina VS20]|uniref:TKL protein kinase n=1 Tax=Saprolegnia diclina (strain VS20) TaxID=1156394 RepID=T0Q406_SAPDV|nr:TKL protein kinase [Saprolegnia diclina VS20]EQC29326.1 TKL protein kinase [Saprolegnia diclina VS20]|eukprot:XP_008617300.1 TKL protein kinase [Saprolegnia diclina VS20]